MSKKLSQAEIDELIQKMVSGEISPEEMEAAMAEDGSGTPAVGAAPEAHAPVATAPAAPPPDPNLDLGPITQAEVDAALRAAGKNSLITTASSPSPGIAPAAPAVPAPPVAPPAPAMEPPAAQAPFVPANPATQILMDLELTMTAELVRTRMRLNQLLQLQPGSVLELNRKANEPVDLVVGGRQVMKAKVITIGEHYGVQITESKVQRTIAS